MKQFLARLWIWGTKENIDDGVIVNGVIEGIKDAANVWPTDDEVKALVKQRQKNIDLYVLKEMDWKTYKAVRVMTDAGWRDLVPVDGSIEVTGIDEEANNPFLTICIRDQAWNISHESLKISIWIFMSRNWCTVFGLDEIKEAAEALYPKTW